MIRAIAAGVIAFTVATVVAFSGRDVWGPAETQALIKNLQEHRAKSPSLTALLPGEQRSSSARNFQCFGSVKKLTA